MNRNPTKNIVSRHRHKPIGVIGLQLKAREVFKNDESLHYYLDIALQHLGKVQYSMGSLETALQSFQKALGLRIKKKDQDLIDSSQTAIERCRLKLSQRK